MGDVQRMNEEKDFQTFKTIFFYCIIIIAAPVFTFFSSKYFVFDGFLTLNTIPSNIYSAVAAVIVLHIGLGMFIYRAYHEAEIAKPLGKRD